MCRVGGPRLGGVMNSNHIVTAHAVLRHLERVQGVDIAMIKAAMDRVGITIKTDPAVLAFIERYTNIDVSVSVRSIIDTKARCAAAYGAKAIIAHGFRYVLSEGAVVSVVPSKSLRPLRESRRGERKPKHWRVRAIREVAAA